MLESQEGCYQRLRTFIFGLYIADGNTVAAGVYFLSPCENFCPQSRESPCPGVCELPGALLHFLAQIATLGPCLSEFPFQRAVLAVLSPIEDKGTVVSASFN